MSQFFVTSPLLENIALLTFTMDFICPSDGDIEKACHCGVEADTAQDGGAFGFV